MDKPDNWLDAENCFFDATTSSESEWNGDATERDDTPGSDVRPSAKHGRVMVIGFSLVRV